MPTSPRRPPERVELQTCIGCGARDRVGACTGDCGEVRLDLVDAGAYERRVAERDALAAFAATAAAALAPLREGGGAALPEDDARARWPALRAAAASALAAAPGPPTGAVDDAARPVVATTWWCPACDRIEAPQPCIGVCVRRPEPMVASEMYDSVDAEAVAAAERARPLLRALRLAATVTPRDGRYAETWAALAARRG